MQNKHTFDDFIGNEQAVTRIKLLLGDKKKKVSHMLIAGPSGHGKTKLGQILADELDRNFCLINCTAAKSPLALREEIIHPDNTTKGAIILMDEAHELSKKTQDNFLTLLEDPAVLVTCYKNQFMRDYLNSNITFVFATTHCGELSEALSSRLETIELQEYSLVEKIKIAIKVLTGPCGIKPDNIEVDAINEIAMRARSARDIKRYCENMVRYIDQQGLTCISLEVALKVFEIFGIDSNGLLNNDRVLLGKLNKAGHVGLNTLEALLHVSQKEITTKIEPYLLRRGFINRSSAGRAITPAGILALRGQRVI